MNQYTYKLIDAIIKDTKVALRAKRDKDIRDLEKSDEKTIASLPEIRRYNAAFKILQLAHKNFSQKVHGWVDVGAPIEVKDHSFTLKASDGKKELIDKEFNEKLIALDRLALETKVDGTGMEGKALIDILKFKIGKL